MAKTLIVAATEIEVEGLRMFLGSDSNFEFLVTGVGMVNTTFSLTKRLSSGELPSKVLNVGIAGAFDQQMEIGQVVQIVTDRFSELGAENYDAFVKADEMSLIDSGDMIFNSKHSLKNLQPVTGITVNTIHGEEGSIAQVKHLFNCDVESMEGAAVAFVASRVGIEWIQVRSISNYVERRNKDNWDIPSALNNLTIQVSNILKG